MVEAEMVPLMQMIRSVFVLDRLQNSISSYPLFLFPSLFPFLFLSLFLSLFFSLFLFLFLFLYPFLFLYSLILFLFIFLLMKRRYHTLPFSRSQKTLIKNTLKVICERMKERAKEIVDAFGVPDLFLGEIGNNWLSHNAKPIVL